MDVRLAGMNILIEDCDTLEYLTNDAGWTKIAADGKCFPKIGRAHV